MLEHQLTRTQRMLRPIINWLVEKWFPFGCFYGHEYLNEFKQFDETTALAGKTSAMYLTSIMRKHGGDKITYQMTGITDREVLVGDYRLTLEKLD